MFEPADQLGLYGKDPLNDLNTKATIWVSTGNSGQGMTGGTISGMVLSALIAGRDHPWAELYNPSRIPPISGTSLEVWHGHKFISEIQWL